MELYRIPFVLSERDQVETIEGNLKITVRTAPTIDRGILIIEKL